MFAEGSKDGLKYTEAGYATTTHKLNPFFYMHKTECVTVKGGSYGFAYQGHAQAHVLEKVPNSTDVIVKASAGFIKEVGEVEGNLFWYTTYGFRADEPWSYNDIHHQKAVMQEDGTVRMTFPRTAYEQIRVGDVITTRPRGGYHAVNTDYSKNVWYQDITVFASMAATCFHEYYNETSITYYRVADVYRSGMVITKETYGEYKALEEAMHKKGYTDFTTEVWYDDVHDCYRGPAFRNASLDGVHVVSSKGGAQVISSVFERLGDDGTNQFGGYARLSAVRDNGDGTMDLIYKGNLSEYWFYNGTGSSTRTAHTSLRRFEPGHHMIVYTNGGNLVLDATAMTSTTNAHKLKNDADLIAQGGAETLETYHVKVKINEFHEDVLAEYLPYLDEYTDDKNAVLDSHYNAWQPQYKVYVHQDAYASAGARIENTKVTCGRSRAALLRACKSTIKNCTYEHIGAPAIGILFEPYWGESAIVQDMKIENNLISHTGFRKPGDLAAAPISIDAPGELNIEKSAIYRNITIRGNVLKNRATDWAIFVDGVAGVIIENNDLGRKADMEGFGGKNLAICLQNCIDVKIEGNTFPNPTMSLKNAINLTNVKRLTGKDVNGGDMFPECK